MNPVRVLVVDDSAFARKVLREVLSADPRIEVVGFARNGLDALEKVEATKPDVVTLDLVMPELDGLGVLQALGTRPDPPRVVLVTMTDVEGPLGIAALQAGAFDIVAKPTALATDRLYELGAELVEKVMLAAAAPARRYGEIPRGAPPKAPRLEAKGVDIVVVGTSTGGPRAITSLLTRLPASFPVPLALVVHMPLGYTESFAKRVDRESALEVVEAEPGLDLLPGRAVIARAGVHLAVHAKPSGLFCTLEREPSTTAHRPSVDVLFSTAASTRGDRVLGVVLTGMGNDGLEGARAIRSRGGRVLVEAEESCVVYGMPRTVAEAKLADAAVSLERLPAAILERL